MPSQALLYFERNLIGDVDRLVTSHADLNHDGMGRRGLGHITRSGVVMLCAAWERYVETLLVNAVEFLTQAATSPNELPVGVRQGLARAVDRHQHDLRCLDLAGDGWKQVYIEWTTEESEKLNTPKSTIINPLFLRHLALDELSAAWSCGAQAVDDFVADRGAIAHTGQEAQYVRIGNLEDYRQMIDTVVVETDNVLADHLAGVAPTGKSPWRRRAL